MARRLLRLRLPGRFLERDLVLVVPRLARRKEGRLSEEMEKIGAPQPRSKSGVQWARLMRNSNFLRLLLMYHTYCWGAYFYLSWLHTYLERAGD